MSKKRFDTNQIGAMFGKYAHQYDELAALQQEVNDTCLALAKEYWKKNAHILDLGTGTGMLAKNAAEQKIGWNITGLDLSFSMCKTASSHERVVNANAESLPFADSTFDGVFSSLMLQWSNDPFAVFKEMARVIKHGGQCIVSTFTYGTLNELRESFKSIDNHRHVNDFGPPNFFSALAVHAGFQVLLSEEDEYTEYYPDVTTLLRSLKMIGASTKEGEIRKTLMTPRHLQKLEHTYHLNFIHADGLPVSWQVMTMMLRKP